MADFRHWGATASETELLRKAGFTRRNTRRAILEFVRKGIEPGEELLELHATVYRLQMGFLALTDRRVVAGMSWAFLPFIKRRRSLTYGVIEAVSVRRQPWGASLGMLAGGHRLRVANLEDPLAGHIRDAIEARRLGAGAIPPDLAAGAPGRLLS